MYIRLSGIYHESAKGFKAGSVRLPGSAQHFLHHFPAEICLYSVRKVFRKRHNAWLVNPLNHFRSIGKISVPIDFFYSIIREAKLCNQLCIL